MGVPVRAGILCNLGLRNLGDETCAISMDIDTHEVRNHRVCFQQLFRG